LLPSSIHKEIDPDVATYEGLKVDSKNLPLGNLKKQFVSAKEAAISMVRE
jgi:hypothetical protein